MKIVHIIAGMPPESGIAVVVTRLAAEQFGLGHEVAVATTKGGVVLKFEPASLGATPSQGSSKVLKLERENIRLREYVYGGQVEHSTSAFANTATADRSNVQHRTGVKGVRGVMFSRSWPQTMYFSWGMLFGLGKELRDADVVHVHSSWTFPVWWGAWLALRHKKTLVMSPHGCLDPVRLKHSGWKKQLIGWMDRWLLRRASVIHATCEAENAWIQAFLETPRQGAADPRRPKIVVVPNGVGIPAPGRGSP